jgi:hypothetical protein
MHLHCALDKNFFAECMFIATKSKVLIACSLRQIRSYFLALRVHHDQFEASLGLHVYYDRLRESFREHLRPVQIGAVKEIRNCVVWYWCYKAPIRAASR